MYPGDGIVLSLFVFSRGMGSRVATCLVQSAKGLHQSSDNAAPHNPPTFFARPGAPSSDRTSAAWIQRVAQRRPLGAAAPAGIPTTEGHSRSFGASMVRLNLLRTSNYHHCLLFYVIFACP